MSDEKEKSIGALWVNKEKQYMKGSVEIDGVKHDIVIFRNTYKKEDKHPDYKIFKSRPKPAEVEDHIERGPF